MVNLAGVTVLLPTVVTATNAQSGHNFAGEFLGWLEKNIYYFNLTLDLTLIFQYYIN